MYNFSKQKIWYHGTLTLFENNFDTIKISAESRPMDFGSGFYLTENKAQAIAWARKRAHLYNKIHPHQGHTSPMLITCSIRFDAISDFVTVNFGKSVTPEFLDFLVTNRLLHSFGNNYDLVYGLVADGSHLIDTLKAYQAKTIGPDMARRAIVYKSVQTQLCIRNSNFAKEYVTILAKEKLLF